MKISDIVLKANACQTQHDLKCFVCVDFCLFVCLFHLILVCATVQSAMSSCIDKVKCMLESVNLHLQHAFDNVYTLKWATVNEYH